RVHVIDVRQPDAGREPGAVEAGLLVRVQQVEATGPREAPGQAEERRIERELGDGRADGDVAYARRTGRAVDDESIDARVVAEGVGDQLDRVAEAEQRADPVQHAERRAARAEEG